MVVVIVIVVVMMVMAAAFLVVIMVVMVMVRFLFQTLQLQRNAAALLHRLHDLCAGQLVPRGGDEDGVGVVLADELDAGVQLVLRHAAGAGEKDGVGGLDLVVIELAEVLHIHFALRGVRDGDEIAELDLVGRDLAHGSDDVGELADARRLDEDTVGVVVGDDLAQRLAKVAHERAADAAGVHLGDAHARFRQEARVDADLAELVLNEHELLTLIRLADHFADERCLAGAEKARININFCHKNTFCNCYSLFPSIARCCGNIKRPREEKFRFCRKSH